MNLVCQKPLCQITKGVGFGWTPPLFFQNSHIFPFFLANVPHLVVTLVRGVPERGSGRLLLVRHHAQQLLNLEAGVDTGAAGADTLRKKIYRFFARICVKQQEAPLGLGKGGAV